MTFHYLEAAVYHIELQCEFNIKFCVFRYPLPILNVYKKNCIAHICENFEVKRALNVSKKEKCLRFTLDIHFRSGRLRNVLEASRLRTPLPLGADRTDR